MSASHITKVATTWNIYWLNVIYWITTYCFNLGDCLSFINCQVSVALKRLPIAAGIICHLHTSNILQLLGMNWTLIIPYLSVETRQDKTIIPPTVQWKFSIFLAFPAKAALPPWFIIEQISLLLTLQPAWRSKSTKIIKQVEKLKSCKMKEGWMKNDECWRMNDEGWWFQAVEGFCDWRTDERTNERTDGHLWM